MFGGLSAATHLQSSHLFLSQIESPHSATQTRSRKPDCPNKSRRREKDEDLRSNASQAFDHLI